MIYNIGDRFLLCGVEGKVAFINASNCAYLVPEHNGEEYNNKYTLTGLVFAILDKSGKDSLGRSAVSINNHQCGAV